MCCESIECIACAFTGSVEDFEPQSCDAVNMRLPECPECGAILGGEEYEGIY